MLHLYAGTDVSKVREAAHAFLLTLRSNGVEVQNIDGAIGSVSLLEDALGATSLFGTHQVYLIDTPSESADFYDALKVRSNALKESQNSFVIIEKKISESDKAFFQESTTSCIIHNSTSAPEFNIFALTDALCARDKKQLWILLMDAFRGGQTSEEIIGTLLWQLKTLRLALQCSTAEEAGMKPFVYGKAKKSLGKFSKGELEKLSHELVVLYHRGHRGEVSIGEALEAWVLKL